MGFFPPNALHEVPEFPESRERWYAAHLEAMKEAPLYPPTADRPDVYRLLFLPTFHAPAVVRFTRTDGGWRLVAKGSDGLGGYRPGRLISEVERDLSPGEAAQFDSLLERVGFWKMRSVGGETGLDGSEAVLEGVRAGRYHVVDRWSPHSTPYAELVEFALGMCQD
jgi:hypothetical protein